MNPRALRFFLFVTLGLVALVVSAVNAHGSPRVTGGTKVDRGEYDARWGSIVSLQFGIEGDEEINDLIDEDSGSGARGSHVCGGTLVTPTIVVTAAHCVEALDTFRLSSAKMRVLVGARVLTDTFKKQPGRMVDVDHVRVHPNWNPSSGIFGPSGNFGYDVAVLVLATAVTDRPVMPLIAPDQRALWGGGSGLPTGALTAGWGVTNALYSDVDIDEADESQRELRETGLPLLSDKACETSDSAMGFEAENFDRVSMLCAYGRDTDRRLNRSNRRGSCFGDSGGPLIVPDGAGGFRLVGVVSWGPNEGGGCNRTSVYTRVDAMRDFVEQVIADQALAPQLVAPQSLAGAAINVKSLRVSWAPGVGAPSRHRILQEVPYLEALDLDEDELRESLEEESDGDEIPKAVLDFVRNLRLLVPAGVGGAEASSLVIRDIEPGRRGQRRTHAFRLEVTDAQGRRSLGPAVRVAAPIDTAAPGRPLVRRLSRDRGAPVIGWKTVADNDCVERYEVHFRRAGQRGWRELNSFDGSCPDASDAFGEDIGALAGFDHEDKGDFDEDTGLYSLPLYGIPPARYVVRVVARDRAGNRSVGPPRAMQVLRRTVTEKTVCRRVGREVRCTGPDAGELLDWFE